MNWLLLRNSLWVGGLTTLLGVSFGLLAGVWVSGLNVRVRNWVFTIAAMAFALPPFLVANCWIHYLGFAGVWRGWLPLNIFSLAGTVWILSLLLWPITLFFSWSAWQKLESPQLEAEPALAGWRMLRHLLLPMARGPLAQAAVLTFVLALNAFAVPAILQVKVFPAEIWIQFSTTFDTFRALQLSWPLVVAFLLLLFWFKARPVPWPRTEGYLRPSIFRRQLGTPWFCFCGGVAVALLLLSVGLPVFQLIALKRTWIELPGALAAGRSALWNSLWFAGGSASLIVGLSLLFAGNDTGRRSVLGSLLARLSWLPLFLPGVLVGMALIALLNRPWTSAFYTSSGIVFLAFFLRYLGLGWNTVLHARRAVDRELVDVARVEGARRWQILRHAVWPQIAPQVAVAWYLVFLLCLWDVESMILVHPPGGETLALRVFNLLHYGYNAQVNALCLTLLFVAIAPLLLWRLVRALQAACHPQRTTTAATAQFKLMTAGCVGLFLAGCAPKEGRESSPLPSRTFAGVQVIGSRGTGVGQLNKPRSVAVDSQDNLYVVDMTGRVQKFAANGSFLLSWQMPQTDLGKPKGMGRDQDGNLMVIEPHYQRVNHFSPVGSLLLQWGSNGTNEGQFKLPRALAMNSHREILVSEYSVAERVQRFALPSGGSAGASSGKVEFLNSFGKAGTGPGEFNRPEGLCVDAGDRIYVADSCNHRIQIFTREGKFLRAYGKAGTALGELSYPYDICVDPSGTQYVCEFGNSRIQVFDSQDRPVEIIGGPGVEPGRFSNPWGVALDSHGNLYVADSLNHRVQKLVRKET